MNFFKTILLCASLSVSFASARTAMVDGISDDMIASVDGEQQVVVIKGPSDLTETKAVILKPQQENGSAEIVIIGTKGVQNFNLGGNSKLELSLEGEGMFGNESTISSNKAGSLIITLQNTAVGRDRFKSDIYVAYRNNEYILAGFKHSYYDTLDEKNSGSCEYNLLTGKGTKNGHSVKVKKEKIAFKNIANTEKLYSCDGW